MRALRFAILGIGLLLAGVAAQAQSVRLKADVPFAFAVGKTALPAGEYRIDSLGTENRVLLIRSMDQNAQASTISNTGRSLEKSDQTKLVFHRYGDRYFLAEIWVQGYSSGHQLPQSKR